MDKYKKDSYFVMVDEDSYQRNGSGSGFPTDSL